MPKSADGGRSKILAALRRELFGPEPGTEPLGQPLSTDQRHCFEQKEDAYGPFHEVGSGEEILQRDKPTKRYGVGVLYPRESVLIDANEGGDPNEDPAEALEAQADNEDGGAQTVESAGRYAEAMDDDFDLTTTSQYRPSAMAVSFLARMQPGDTISMTIESGRYQPFKVEVAGKEFEWFVRRQVSLRIEFDAPDRAGRHRPRAAVDASPLVLDAELRARPHADGAWLCTLALINRAESSPDTASLFQAGFEVAVEREGQTLPAVLPYPDASNDRLLERDPEARSLDLLYRKLPTFAVGHGCAATWAERQGEVLCRGLVANALPEFEAASVTPDVRLADGTPLAVPMGPLAGLDEHDDGFGTIAQVAGAYSEWIDRLESDAQGLKGHRRVAADSHVEKCREAHQRMVDGIGWLRDDPIARRAFVLANEAILNQQLNFRPKARAVKLKKSGLLDLEPRAAAKDWRDEGPSWRAFQIGFLVSAARSAVDGTDRDRETVDLIFFPTGGGKTEAYLGLAAFSLFYQRLTDQRTGVGVIMRYTLRLLTSQQFLRASALVCAMELIREREGLPKPEFSIGIWVGGSTTPNTRKDAIAALKKLKGPKGENPFLVLRCPWCAAQMGPIDADPGTDSKFPRVVGYERTTTITFECPDSECEFSRRRLPIFVVDEDLYKNRPSIVIGTIDKFAMLAFRPEASSLFGLEAGERHFAPPSLIIQDELHLIGGPLGSMAGLYEPIIERLCTTDDGGSPPKIVASTATIRNYPEQIRVLYGRKDAALFPPHGLDADDSFFAVEATDPETGEREQGRLYVGVHAPGLGSIQTAQVRTAASLLQAPLALDESERDPWWTSLMFFNSLRELGTSVSLLQSDIPDYLFTAKLRDGHEKQRYPNHLMELTSRLRQDEVPESIKKLEVTASDGGAVDVCLASNIIEVGVDIPRLSLLTVLGQPKTTSQYIQITGRVGRKWEKQPGLVVTLYSASRPRDRSHFEKFQAYHQRLYAEVEPVSVTPFSLPVLSRAAHAAAIVYARQHAALDRPDPVPEEVLEQVEELLCARAAVADPETIADVRSVLRRRWREWSAWEPSVWEHRGGDEGQLMVRAGEWVPQHLRQLTWPTPMSMRDVDAECRTSITNRYAVKRGEAEEETE